MYLKISHRAYLSAAQRYYLLLPASLIQHYCFQIIPQLSCFPSIHLYSVTLIFHLLQEWFVSIHLPSTKTFFLLQWEGKERSNRKYISKKTKEVQIDLPSTWNLWWADPERPVNGMWYNIVRRSNELHHYKTNITDFSGAEKIKEIIISLSWFPSLN